MAEQYVNEFHNQMPDIITTTVSHRATTKCQTVPGVRRDKHDLYFTGIQVHLKASFKPVFLFCNIFWQVGHVIHHRSSHEWWGHGCADLADPGLATPVQQKRPKIMIVEREEKHDNKNLIYMIVRELEYDDESVHKNVPKKQTKGKIYCTTNIMVVNK